MKGKFIDSYTYGIIVLKNKFNIQEQKELDKFEISYCYLNENNYLKSLLNSNNITINWDTILKIHYTLFNRIYDFAGQIRTVNISKLYSFAPAQFIELNLINSFKIFNESNKDLIDIMTYYCDINFIHPFREGNGRSGRLLLEQIVIKYLKKMIDWSKISKQEYLDLMIKNHATGSLESLKELELLISNALVELDIIDKKLASSIHTSIQYEYDYDISPVTNYKDEYINIDKK